MASVRGFILSHFGKNYFLIFLPFFAILSIVYIIRISILSNQISLSGGEIMTLFGFFLPDILFYTLPLSFIAAVTVTFTKLSQENELIALFSFGLTPSKLLRILLGPSILFAILMLILSLYTIPQSTFAYKLFESEKRSEAKLTIAPNRMGQKFGEYMVFLDKKIGDSYRSVVLFTTDTRQKRVIIIADEATMENNNSLFSLTLTHGTGDTFLTDRIESIQYEQMKLYNNTQHHINTAWLNRGWSQISTRKKDMSYFIYNIFLSLSPLLVLGMIAAFTIVNPRYQNSHPYMVGFSVAFSVYITASLLRKGGTPLILLVVGILFMLGGWLLFRKRIREHF